MSLDIDFPPPLIVVVDTSVLIGLKSTVHIDNQWSTLTRMHELVTEGSLAFPKQVAKELAYGEYPDAPGAWVGSAKREVSHQQPSEDTLIKVLAAAPLLVDIETTDDREVADPYVAAMALDIKDAHDGCRVVVATDDKIDRLPVKVSLVTACDQLGIETCTPKQFVAWVNEGVLPGPEVDVDE
jgi:hypothetical protein